MSVPPSIEGFVAQLPQARQEIDQRLGIPILGLVEFADDLDRALKAHYAARSLVEPASAQRQAMCKTLDILMIGAMLAEVAQENRS